MTKPITLEIDLPERLEALARRDRSLYGPLNQAVGRFSVWLSDNKTPFFFEYTDHGIAHVSNVLRSAEALVPDASWECMSAQDASAVVMAVLLHDCAMHLSEEGFFSLLDQKEVIRSSFLTDERTWTDEYVAFEQEAARWDAVMLISVFGDSNPPERVKDRSALTHRQRLLVGEFLRRHHARLAHEIAINGVPGPCREARFLPLGEFSDDLCDFYGFLARSHNLPMRKATDALPKLQRRRCMEVHAPFVMALLRIADYIQIDSARAPTHILQLRGLKSPVSREEWAKHHAVIELSRLWDDPEALTVITKPKSVQVFVGLRLLFRDLQRELDESWAMLGEIYGRVETLKYLGLTVRRLRTNLDNVSEFEATNKPSYVPREIRLTTASAELLHLLVGPLYGNKPSVGVRELLQNAIDATLERISFTQDGEVNEYHPSIDVEVDVASPMKYIRIRDNGVGMSLETLESYFLKAGASFRRSQWWKGQFADDAGKSLVRRSGRFGVGALAAFLIGPSIELVSRHFLDKTGQGLAFKMTLDDGLIEVRRVQAEIGTTITIPISSSSVAESLKAKGNYENIPFYSWFIYDTPTLRYRMLAAEEWESRVPVVTIQEPFISQNSDWTEIECDGFERVLWSYSSKIVWENYSHHYVACNGIIVCEAAYRSTPVVRVSGKGGIVDSGHPAILIDDRDGLLPLNIQRSGLAQDEYPFQRNLVDSIADELCRELYISLGLPAIPTNVPKILKRVYKCLRKYGNVSGTTVGLGANGWLPLEPAMLRRFMPKCALIEAVQKGRVGLIPNWNMDDLDGLLLIPHVLDSTGFGAIQSWVRAMLLGSQWNYRSPFEFKDLNIAGGILFISSQVQSFLARPSGGLPKYLWDGLKEVVSEGDWIVYQVGEIVDGYVDVRSTIERARACDAVAFFFHFTRDESANVKGLATPLSSGWLSLCPDGYLLPAKTEEKDDGAIEFE